MSSNYKVSVFETTNDTAKALCARLVNNIELLCKDESRDAPITIGLSGASMITQLGNELPLHNERLAPLVSKLRFLFCDERYVSLEHDENTYCGYLRSGFFEKLNVDRENQVLKINPCLSLDQCADEYASRLGEVLDKARNGFDILLLGMGPDGHTCSLFPEHKSLSDCFDSQTRHKLVIPVRNSPKPPPERVTLTLDCINNSRFIYFLTCGESKADVLRKILVEKDEKIPSTNVRPARSDSELVWFVDKAAASKLD